MTRSISTEKKLQTRKSLAHDFVTIGLKPRMNVMVHSSLSAIGWVLGGAPTVVRALLDVLGKDGTLIMPAATPLCADPRSWDDLTIPEPWVEEVREHLPLFDLATTPTTVGAIAECFRTWPGTLRSDHPLSSVCGNGPLAKQIVSQHALGFSEGNGTPFEQVYDLECWILLLGVGFNRCTALHFAESRVENRRVTRNRFPTLQHGRRVWVEVPDMANDNSTHFPVVGEQFVSSGKPARGAIGSAESILFAVQDLVDFAVTYFREQL